MIRAMQILKRLSPRPQGRGYGLFKPSEEGSSWKGVLPVALLISGLVLLGCENQPTEVENYDPQPVLQGYLINGRPVDRIYLQWVAPIYGYYDVNNYGIADAQMVIYPLSGGQDTLHLTQELDSTWIYKPVTGESLIPQSGIRYRIEVSKPSENIYLSSEALMPDTFGVQIYPAPLPAQLDTLDTLTRNDPNIYFAWDTSDSAGGYNLNVTCLTPRDSLLAETLLPLDPDFNPDEDELKPEDIELTAFWPMRDDQRDMVVPWFLFNYEGWHRIEMQAVSAEYYDYGMSIFRQNAGIPIELAGNVNGGLGIFAALSTNVYWVYMLRVE